MHITWGKQNVYKRLGYAVEFCPICRDISPFLISRIGIANHINYLSFDDGVLLGYTGECSRCQLKKPVDAKKFKGFVQSIFYPPNNNIEYLIVATYPNIRVDIANRLETERKIKEHHIFSPAEREVLISEPFKLLAYRVLERNTQSKLDKEGGLGCLLIIIILTALWSIPLFFPHSKTIIGTICPNTILIFFFGIIYTFLQFRLARNRFIKKEIVPLLAKTLLPLNPKQYEIAKYLNEFKWLGKNISEQQLLEQLQKIRNPHY